MKTQIRNTLAGRGSGKIGSADGAGSLSSGEVARITGASMRQLQWWDEQNVIHPIRIVGGDREWSRGQLATVECLVGLRRYGLSLQKCRKLIARHPESLRTAVDALSTLKRLGLKVR